MRKLKKKIVTLTGHKFTKKTIVASKLASNSDVVYVQPYTDRELPKWAVDGEELGFHFVLPSVLDKMIEEEDVLTMKTVNENRYVFFKFQFIAPYNVVIVDDYGVLDIKNEWDDLIYTIRLVSDKEKQSDRVGEYLFKHEFDLIFDYDKDDFDEMESKII